MENNINFKIPEDSEEIKKYIFNMEKRILELENIIKQLKMKDIYFNKAFMDDFK